MYGPYGVLDDVSRVQSLFKHPACKCVCWTMPGAGGFAKHATCLLLRSAGFPRVSPCWEHARIQHAIVRHECLLWQPSDRTCPCMTQLAAGM